MGAVIRKNKVVRPCIYIHEYTLLGENTDYVLSIHQQRANI